MKLVHKILFQSKNNLQIIFSGLGVFLGMSALLLSVLLFNDVKSYQQSDKELFGENSIIIQKKVTKFTSIGLNSTEFSEEDISILKQKEFIEKVAPFESANYKVGISEYPGDGLPPFYADMFFQSIPDEFIDVDTEWKWDKNSEFVPIILPRDFLMLINYGIAESQGMPQISEDLLAAARLQIHMSGQQKKGQKLGKVVGFSHKISSILVPKSFLDYSNQIYGSEQQKMPLRLFITIKDGSFGELQKLMDDMNLDIHKSALDMSKIKTFVNMIISIFLFLSILIIILSIFGFIQYVQLILSQSKVNVIILFKQGYTLKYVRSVIVKHFAKIFGIITVLSVISVLFVKFTFIQNMLENNGIVIASNGIVLTIFISLIGLLLLIVSNFVSTKLILKKIFTGR